MKSLIVVDYEKEWINENSDYFVGNITNKIEKLNKLLAFCRQNNYKIIFTVHEEEEGEAFRGEGIKLIDSINYQNKMVIKKNRVSPFFKTSLEQELKGVEEIVVTGILTNLCVRSLVEGAYDRDFDITVITDSCVAFSDEVHDFTIKDLKKTREEVKFKTVEEFTN